MSSVACLPAIGLGTCGIDGAAGKEIIKSAIDIGYRMFDTAYAYENERTVGEAIAEKIANDASLKREDFFVVSKLDGRFHRKDLVEKCCRESVMRLGMSYVDLYLMHTPVALKPGNQSNITFDDTIEPSEAWQGLEECYRLGLCKNIGVSNFNQAQLENLLGVCTVRPMVNEIECSIGYAELQLRQFCAERNISILAYCPLGKQKLPFLTDNRLVAIANEVGRTVAQVALRFLVELGTIPLPKTTNPARLKENFHIFDFQLTEGQIKLLHALGGTRRACRLGFLKSAKHYPFERE